MSSELVTPSGTRAGQATMVESARAVAEVRAMMLMAQEFPRSINVSRARMEDACKQYELAEVATFRMPRGGSQITGPSIHLARELAVCWGNITFDIKEMSRNDQLGQSEMFAYAWDLQTNVRSGNTFIVEHKMDVGSGTRKLVSMNDIYLNNANAAARRLREAIFGVIPRWFRVAALDLCKKTLVEKLDGKDGRADSKPLAYHIQTLIKNFAGLHVTVSQLEAKIGMPEAKWTADDVAALFVIGKSIQNGDTARDDEFPPVRVEAADLATAPDKDLLQKIKDSAVSMADVERNVAALNETMGLGATHVQRDTLKTLLSTLEYNTDLDGAELDDIRTLVGRNDITGLDSLTPGEATALILRLEEILTDSHPGHALDAVLAHLRDGQDQ